MKFLIFLLFGSVILSAQAARFEDSPSNKSPDQWVSYAVRRHDNLNDLAQHFLISKKDLPIIQQLNRIKDPNLLPVGKKLLFPRSLLKFTVSKAQVLACNCSAEAASLDNGSWVNPGATLTEGQIVEVPVGCAVDLQLDDGSQIRLPSNSTVKLTHLRHNELESSPEVLLDLIKGRVSLEVHKPRSTGTPFEVHTPISVMGVRGTEFSVSLDDENTARLEVLEGRVQSQGAGDTQPQIVIGGQGLLIDAAGSSRMPETLPGKPIIQNLSFANAGTGAIMKLTSQPSSDHWLIQKHAIANRVESVGHAQSDEDIHFEQLGVEAVFLNVTGATHSNLLGPTEGFALCVPQAGRGLCNIAFEAPGVDRESMIFSLSRLDNASVTEMIVNKKLAVQDGHFMLRGLPVGHYVWNLSYSSIGKNHQPVLVNQSGHFQLLTLAPNH